MTTENIQSRGGSGGLFFVTLAILLFVGSVLSAAAYFFADNDLSILEAIGAGFGGVAAIIIGLIAAVFGIVLGLFGALTGILAAGGAVALTLFIVGSPIIAIVLIVLLMRSRKSDCPDPDVHRIE